MTLGYCHLCIFLLHDVVLMTFTLAQMTTVWSTLVGVYLNVCMTLDVAIKHKTSVYVVLYQRKGEFKLYTVYIK